MSGKKNDAGKPRPSLLPMRGIGRVIAVLEHGAEKYGVDNWRRVANFAPRYTDALLRHALALGGGEFLDPDSGLPHAAHIACCALFLLEGPATIEDLRRMVNAYEEAGDLDAARAAAVELVRVKQQSLVVGSGL